MLVRYTLSLPAQHSLRRESTNLIINEGREGEEKGRGGKLFPRRHVSPSRSLLFSSFPFVSCGKNAYPFHILNPTPSMSFVHMHVSEWMRHNTEMSWVNIDSCDPRIVHIWTVELQRKFAALFSQRETSGWQADGWRNLSCGAIICHHRKSRRGGGGGSPLLLHHVQAFTAHCQFGEYYWLEDRLEGGVVCNSFTNS